MSAPAFEDPGEAFRFAEYRRAQIAEYGQWVAVAEIRVGGALAFAVGHPVPASTVAAHGWDRDGLVVATGTVAPEAGVDRAAQLRARQAELTAEQAAIAAELGEDELPAILYAAMKVDELRAELADRGLPVSGTKDELVARLEADDETPEEDDDEDEDDTP